MRLKRVEEWTRDKPRLPALMSAFLVINVEDLHSVLRGLSGDRGMAELLVEYDNAEMEELYSDPTKAVCELYAKEIPEVFPEEHAKFQSYVKQLEGAQTVTQSRIALEEMWVHGLLNDFEWEEEELSSELREKARKRAKGTAALGWLFKICLPCIIMHRVGADELYERARSGDMEAIAGLALFDKGILSRDRKIQGAWERKSAVTPNAAASRLIRALGKNGLRGIKRKRMKRLAAVAIEVTFEATKESISRREIRDLFDAFAADFHGEMIDKDLPESEEGFSKAVQRERREWDEVIKEAERIVTETYKGFAKRDLKADK